MIVSFLIDCFVVLLIGSLIIAIPIWVLVGIGLLIDWIAPAAPRACNQSDPAARKVSRG
jgi:type IV secretory pathway TrbD component